MEAFVPGIYARSEALVQATRDLDRGRTTQAAVDALLQSDLEDLVRAQEAAGLDLLADGMLRWNDVFRPLVDASDGLELGALTRFLDTNTFFRARVAAGEPRLRVPLDQHWFPELPGPRLVTLPSPHALAHGTGLSPEAVAKGVLKPQLEVLDTELVVLAEPFLARDDSPDFEALGRALGHLEGRHRLALWLPFADAGPLLTQLCKLRVDAIGVDFYLTSLEAVPGDFPKQLLAGVVDVRSSLLEDPGELAEFASELSQRAERIALVPNGDLQHVPADIARSKIARLGQARSLLGVAA